MPVVQANVPKNKVTLNPSGDGLSMFYTAVNPSITRFIHLTVTNCSLHVKVNPVRELKLARKLLSQRRVNTCRDFPALEPFMEYFMYRIVKYVKRNNARSKPV